MSTQPLPSYKLHVLRGVGGYFLYVSQGGETVGLYFGVTERAAAAAAVSAVTAAIGTSDG